MLCLTKTNNYSFEVKCICFSFSCFFIARKAHVRWEKYQSRFVKSIDRKNDLLTMRRPCVGKFIFEDDYVNITERENAAEHWMDVLVVDDSMKKQTQRNLTME